MANEKIYSVRVVNPRRERWKWVFFPAAVLVPPLTALGLGAAFHHLFSKVFALLGTAAGLGLVLGAARYVDKLLEEPATAAVGPHSLEVVNLKTSQQEVFLFSNLVEYRVLNSYQGAASLRLIAQNGHQLHVVGAASPAFTALIGEFDAAILRYERLSGKKITRVEVG